MTIKSTFAVVLFGTFSIGTLAFADDTPPLMQSRPAEVNIDYLSLNMPNGAPDMGLLGLHYDVNLLPINDFYSGLGVYSAVRGNQGGVFILGIDNYYRPQLVGPLHLNAGLFVGAGGSANSQPFGGGLMLLPSVGLGYDFKHAMVNLNYSYARFPSGDIASSQVMLGVTLPLDFTYFDAEDARFVPLHAFDLHFPNGAQEEHWYLSPLVQVYHVKTSTNPGLDDNLTLVGFEGGRYFTQHFYAAVRTLAVAHGDANGYMNIMTGVGYDLPLFGSPIAWTNDVMIGSGGGGSIGTGGGLLSEFDTGFSWTNDSAFTPKLMAGYLTSTNGQFKTWVGTLGFNYNLDALAAGHGAPLSSTDVYAIHEWRVNVDSQTLFNPARTSGSGDLSFLNLDIDQFLSPVYYLNYRTTFPYAGSNPSGGSTVGGMIGIGAEPFVGYRLQPSLTLLVGAIGGGSIDAGGGLVVEPEVGLHYAITSAFGLNTSVGQIKSFQGHLNSTVFNAGISLSFGEAQKTGA